MALGAPGTVAPDVGLVGLPDAASSNPPGTFDLRSYFVPDLAPGEVPESLAGRVELSAVTAVIPQTYLFQ
jgi:hypothetical protein